MESALYVHQVIMDNKNIVNIYNVNLKTGRENQIIIFLKIDRTRKYVGWGNIFGLIKDFVHTHLWISVKDFWI